MRPAKLFYNRRQKPRCLLKSTLAAIFFRQVVEYNLWVDKDFWVLFQFFAFLDKPRIVLDTDGWEALILYLNIEVYCLQSNLKNLKPLNGKQIFSKYFGNYFGIQSFLFIFAPEILAKELVFIIKSNLL